MSEEEIQNSLLTAEEGKPNFSEDEQNIIDAWIAKLSESKETEEENARRYEYARALARLTVKEKRLQPPFTEKPCDGDLPPLKEKSASSDKYSFPSRQLPCSPQRVRTEPTGSKPTGPKSKKTNRSMQRYSPNKNEFENFEEMARIIARSKGQTLTEFVMAISRHTADSGQELRKAMKTETTYFREYVDRILSQRVKEITRILDEEHNIELRKIKEDINRWQLELTNCKKRIFEILPDFDVDFYNMDKNYVKSMFIIDKPGLMRVDSFNDLMDQYVMATYFYRDLAIKKAKCNEDLARKLEETKEKTVKLEESETMKHKNLIQRMNAELPNIKKLQAEVEKLQKENCMLRSPSCSKKS